MQAPILYLLLLIVVPTLGGLLCLTRKRGTSPWTIVAGFTATTIVLALGLLGYMAANNITSISANANELFPMEWVILALDLTLMAYFIYVGVRDRSRWIVAFAILQIIPMVIFQSMVMDKAVDPVIFADYLSIVMMLITSLVGSVIIIYAVRYMRNDGNQPRFFAVMLIFVGAMNGAVFCNDLLWLFFFWEVTTLTSFLLIRHTKTDEAIKSARIAAEITLGGGVLLLASIVLSYYYFNALTISALPAGTSIVGLQLLPFALMAVAAFTKSAQVPFQKWLLGAMVAPTPVSALLHSATMVNLGVYFLLRLSPNLVGQDVIVWIIGIVGTVSFLATSLLAIAQSNSKRVLAYSTIGNLGLIIVCVGLNTPLSITAAVIILLFHAISKALLFMSVGVIKDETGSEDIENMAYLRDRMPFVSISIFIGVFMILLPPFGMFAGKWIVSEANVSFPLIGIILAVGFAASIVYYGKWLGKIFATGPMTERPTVFKEKVPALYRSTLAALMVAGILMSFGINLVTKYLVDPFVGRYYTTPVGNETFSLTTGLGAFPIVLILIVVGLIFLGLGFLFRPNRKDLAQAYTGGEDPEFDLGGLYYADEKLEMRMTLGSNVVAILILIALVALPIALEVFK
ncbi:MAG: proton-conducting transporter membrane subunit [Methanomassiliicoccales archaeon]|jgi:ech hydrogenase subunit A